MFVGLDVGTSGVRACAIADDGVIVTESAVPFDPNAASDDAAQWLIVARDCLAKLFSELPDARNVRAIAVDGTSGSMVLLGVDRAPVTPGLLYNTSGFHDEAARIAAVAPLGSITRGSSSALARLLHLQDQAPDAAFLAHQADYIVAALTGEAGHSDESNALKTGYDARARRWPAWLAEAGVRVDLLPKVHPVGARIGHTSLGTTRWFDIDYAVPVVAGATDSVAAFLASGVDEPGVAVTSLGTTLALKVLSDAPVEDAARGIYSHRIGDRWLPGGASNVGGGSLLAQFTAQELDAITERIDPDWEPRHPDTYPLTRAGERFPRNDPAMAPVLPPREDDARFLFELLHAIARIEREGYEALASLGAPYPTRVLTAGGGARNRTWTAIRERVLGVPVDVLENADAAYGMALTARRAVLA